MFVERSKQVRISHSGNKSIQAIRPSLLGRPDCVGAGGGERDIAFVIGCPFRGVRVVVRRELAREVSLMTMQPFTVYAEIPYQRVEEHE